MGLMNKVNALLGVDIPHMRLENIGRLRPYPYDVTATLALTDGGAPNTFPAGYTALIPAGTYDFGDSPNRLQVERLKIEVMPADTYIIELYKSFDAITYIPLGANRVSVALAITLGISIPNPCRPLDTDDATLYGRLKSVVGGRTINFCLCVSRWLPPTVGIPLSTGVWPWG